MTLTRQPIAGRCRTKRNGLYAPALPSGGKAYAIITTDLIITSFILCVFVFNSVVSILSSGENSVPNIGARTIEAGELRDAPNERLSYSAWWPETNLSNQFFRTMSRIITSYGIIIDWNRRAWIRVTNC